MSTLHFRQRLAPVVTTVTTGVISNQVMTLSPLSIGDRPAAMAALFQRYKFRNLKATYRSATGTTTAGNLIMGFIDDVDPANTNPTADQILNLRRSAEFAVFKDHTVTWSPVDSSRWYYTATDGSALRFQIACALTWISDVATSLTSVSTVGVIDLEGDIVFDGATLVSL